MARSAGATIGPDASSVLARALNSFDMGTLHLAVPRGAASKASWRWRSSRPSVATLGGLATAAVGVVVLLAWVVGAEPLKTTLLGPIAMKANTALCFLLMGTGVALLGRPSPGANGRVVGLALLALPASIALVTLSQYVTGMDLGIDEALFRDLPGTLATVGAGRMSPLTSICFALIALAAFSVTPAPRAVLPLCGAALAVSALNVFTFVFDAAVPSFLAAYSQMALNTAVAMGILALGVVGLLGPASPFALLARKSLTASLLRRVLVALIVVPLAMAWLSAAGQRLGLYDASYGTALRLVAIVMLGTIGVLRWARWTNELESKREAIELERDRFFEQSLDLLAVTDAAGRFRRANRAWEVTLGYPVDELIDRPLFDLVHPDDLERTIAESQLLFVDGGRVVGFQNRCRHRDGSYRWLEWTSTMAPDASMAFSVARDITGRKHAEDRRARRERVLALKNEALSERVFRDALTGLHNRRFFDRAVVRLGQRWRRMPVERRPPVAVILFDLDDFGQVNKDHGHQAGDEILRRFSWLLEERFRARDLVVRYGGEEFVAVLEGVASEMAIGIAEGIRVAFEQAPIRVGTDTPIRVTVSAGCSQLNADGDISAALKEADVWLSQAKRAGRNQVVGL